MNAPLPADAFFPFDNTYARLPDRFFARLPPTPVPAPRLIRLNEILLQDLGLDPDRLSSLFELQSDTYHGGTGEIRCWLTAAAAMGNSKATIVDYMAVHRIITGVAFAYWEPNGASFNGNG